MKHIIQTAAIFCAALALFSCAVQKPATPSGRPEVTISTSVKKAQVVVIDTMASNGFSLTNQTSNSLIFEQDLPPDQAALFLIGMGNSHYSHPQICNQIHPSFHLVDRSGFSGPHKPALKGRLVR